MQKDIVKGQCITCGYCKIKDDGYQRSLVCTQTKRGKTITWTTRTGKLTGGTLIADNTYVGGTFIHNSVEDLDLHLKKSIENRIPPRWCVYRNNEKHQQIGG